MVAYGAQHTTFTEDIFKKQWIKPQNTKCSWPQEGSVKLENQDFSKLVK